MATDKRITASPTEENSIGFRGGGGTGVIISGLHAADGPASAVGRYVDLKFDSYADARSFAHSILGYVGDPPKED